MRVGIMGGTMDPVHNGHIAIAHMVMEHLRLDEMMLLPDGDPPHKRTKADKWHRLKMTKLAAKDAGMTCSDVEVRREKTTFTVDTLTEFKEKRPKDKIFYVVGGDTVPTLVKWRNIEKVAGLCTFAVVARPGDGETEEAIRACAEQTGAKLVLVPGEGPDISSTMVRERVAAGESVKGLVPDKVAAYIERHRLYHAWTQQEMETELRSMIPEKRFIHSIGVMDTAVRLAENVGANPEKARIAALLHDCAKKLTREEMIDSARKGGIELFVDELENTQLLHAPAGAYVARHVFGVNDPEILNAIRLHTVGGPGMTPLEALIYVSDFIEPNRRPIPGLENIRAVAEEDIYIAAQMCGESTKRYVTSQGLPFCAQTQRMLDDLTARRQKLAMGGNGV